MKLVMLFTVLVITTTLAQVPTPTTTVPTVDDSEWVPTTEQRKLINSEIPFDLVIYESIPDSQKGLVPPDLLPTEIMERDRPWALPDGHWDNRPAGLYKTARPVPPEVKLLPGYVPGAAYYMRWSGTNRTYGLVLSPTPQITRSVKPAVVEFVVEFYDELGTNPVAKVTRTTDGDMGFMGTKVIIPDPTVPSRLAIPHPGE